jgi:hypothetical protein
MMSQIEIESDMLKSALDDNKCLLGETRQELMDQTLLLQSVQDEFESARDEIKKQLSINSDLIAKDKKNSESLKLMAQENNKLQELMNSNVSAENSVQSRRNFKDVLPVNENKNNKTSSEETSKKTSLAGYIAVESKKPLIAAANNAEDSNTATDNSESKSTDDPNAKVAEESSSSPSSSFSWLGGFAGGESKKPLIAAANNAEGSNIKTGDKMEAKFYDEANHNSLKAVLSIGDYPDVESVGIKKDSLSSIKVQKGLKVTLFDQPEFKGDKLVLTEDINRLSDKNFNKSKSIKIELLDDPNMKVIDEPKQQIKKASVGGTLGAESKKELISAAVKVNPTVKILKFNADMKTVVDY